MSPPWRPRAMPRRLPDTTLSGEGHHNGNAVASRGGSSGRREPALPGHGKQEMDKPIIWFELPVRDIERATRFYEDVFACRCAASVAAANKWRSSPCRAAARWRAGFYAAAGAARQRHLIYLDGGRDLAEPLARVKAAGGAVAMEDLHRRDIGFFIALFMDSGATGWACFRGSGTD